MKINMDTLYTNIGTLKTSVGELNDGVKALFDGTIELNDGTRDFVNETDGIETKVSGEIDSMITEATGSDLKIASFVSEKNTNVNAVQFVIQTKAIEIAETVIEDPIIEEKLNFWQKFLKLFGLY